MIRQTATPSAARRALSFLRADKGMIAAYLVSLVLFATMSVLPPVLFGKLIDAGVQQGDPAAIARFGTVAVILAATSAGLLVLHRWLAGHVAETVTYRARIRLLAHIRGLPLSFSTHSDTGAVVSRVLNDVAGIHSLVQTLATLLASLITASAILVAMLAVDPRVTLVAVGMFPLFYAPARWATKRMTQQHTERMDSAATLATLTTELVSPAGALLSRLYSTSERDVSMFDRRAERLRDAGIKLVVLNGMFLGSLGLMSAAGTAAVFWIGGLGVTAGRLTVGGLVAAATLTAQLYATLTQLAGTPVNLTHAVVSMRRVYEVLDLDLPVEGAERLLEARGDVAVRNVDFTYPRRESSSIPSLQGGSAPGSNGEGPVLRDVTLDFECGSTTALVGPSGAGKSTLAMLIAGIYVPTRGRILLDGRDVRHLTPASVTAAVGVVSQDTHLLHDTVAANLRYAHAGVSEDEMVRACRAAGIHEFLVSLPDGYGTVVGSDGYRLSGGQKQRLSLARVLLKKPRVVILDEATAHLDTETEEQVREALHSQLADATTIVIAHRLSPVRLADQVVVLRDGRVVEKGSPSELIAAGGEFARMHLAGQRLEQLTSPQTDTDLASARPE